MDTKDTSAKIKQARLEMGWNQQKLANETGFSNKTISAYELGRLKANVPALQRIAAVVNKPVSFFTDETSPDYVIETKLKKIEEELKEIKKLIQMKLPDLTIGVSSPHASSEQNPPKRNILRFHP